MKREKFDGGGGKESDFTVLKMFSPKCDYKIEKNKCFPYFGEKNFAKKSTWKSKNKKKSRPFKESKLE